MDYEWGRRTETKRQTELTYHKLCITVCRVAEKLPNLEPNDYNFILVNRTVMSPHYVI